MRDLGLEQSDHINGMIALTRDYTERLLLYIF